MNIRHYIYTAFAATATLSLVACDEIAEGDRFIEVEAAKAERAVLVEEFSGQFCTNCPDGAEKLAEIHDMYAKENGMDLIVVSIHCGTRQRPPLGLHENNTQYVGLTTDFGEALYAKYNSPALPAAVIDRTTAPIENMEGWLTPISTAFNVPASLTLSAEATYNPADGMITVTVDGRSTQALEGNLHVWLTEDDIVTVQKLKPEDKPLFGGSEYNYEHKFSHIFRASFTPIEGVPAKYDVVATASDAKVFTVKAGDKWNVNNMTVVAFVDNANGVCQAVKASVLNGTKE